MHPIISPEVLGAYNLKQRIMGKTANEIEIERQKSAMLNQGASHNDINNPNTRAHFANTGKLPHNNSGGSSK